MTEKTFFNAVGWIATATGAEFDVLDPDPANVRLHDIAHALSRQCRYAGHCRQFYSVAEHCVHVARFLGRSHPQLGLAALLHDASEAYLVDIPRPIKKAMPQYRDIEDRLMMAIGERYGFTWPMDARIVEIDNRILLDEVEQNMNPPPNIPWGIPGEPLGITLQFWTPNIAQSWFIGEFYRHGGMEG